jgi:predicted permease
MVFRSIAGTSLKGQFDIRVLGITLGVIAAGFALAWASVAAMGTERRRRGAFIQCAIQGNLGYIALAVSFYFLGRDGLARAGLIAGFIMILQNLLSVTALQYHGAASGSRMMGTLAKVLANPVILAAGAGIAFSLGGLSLPGILDRSIEIVSDMSLPLALLIIGASLSFRRLRHRYHEVLSACAVKLLVLPGAGLALFRLFQTPARDYLPALILLAAPTATVTYVMNRELNGDPEYAGVQISLTTLLSAVTYIFWLYLAA